MELICLFILSLVLLAEFVNGWTDAPNAIATIVSTRVLTLRSAVVLATIMNIAGVLSGTAVAVTIGKGIVDASVLEPKMIAAAMISLILWSSLAAQFGIPTSESHALVAGLAGAGLAAAGPQALLAEGWIKIGYGLILSSVAGFLISFIFTKGLIKFFGQLPPYGAQKWFNRLQIFSSMSMSYSHGLNDGQKFIGIFIMTLMVAKVLPEFSVPLWVILLCSLTMGIGTSIGGAKIIKNVGTKMVDIRPWQGFAAQSSASMVVFFASWFGIPLSTTHTITTSIMGVAAGKRLFGSVRWQVATDIILAWAITFPICGTLSFLIVLFLKHF